MPFSYPFSSVPSISSPFSVFVLFPPEDFAMDLHFEHDDELHFEEEGDPFFFIYYGYYY